MIEDYPTCPLGGVIKTRCHVCGRARMFGCDEYDNIAAVNDEWTKLYRSAITHYRRWLVKNDGYVWGPRG